MAFDQTQLAALIGSRICHDLISPVGAINNGLELLAMSGTPDSPEINLITESVGNASARIRFFRIAFGAAGDQMVGPSEIVSILRDFYGGGRLEVLWTPQNPQSRWDVRISFLGLLCLESAMPYGGTITVTQKDTSWQLQGQADKLNVEPEIWSLLSSRQTSQTLRPAHVQFGLLPLIVNEAGRKLVTQADTQQISIRF